MPLDVVVYMSRKPWSTPKEDAFVAGLHRHGLEPELREACNIRKSDLAVIWAHRHKALFDTQSAAGAHYLVMERGYIGDIHKRRQWASLGVDGLNGRAMFPNPDGSDRWNRYFGNVMKPWKDSGDYTVVMGQVRGDASLRGGNIVDWYDEAVDALKEWTLLPVVFRPHPSDGDTPYPKRADRIDRGELGTLLSRADKVVTFNSNTGVDAVLAGVPTISRDCGSMAWDVSSHSYLGSFMPNRANWCSRLAHAQWTTEEIESGEAWEHIAPLIEGTEA